MIVVCRHYYMGIMLMTGPEFNRDCWFNEKFNLGLDFPNVSIMYLFLSVKHFALETLNL